MYRQAERAEGAGAGPGRGDGWEDWDEAAEEAALETVRRKVEDMQRDVVAAALRAAAEGRDPWAAAELAPPDGAGGAGEASTGASGRVSQTASGLNFEHRP